MDTIDLRSDTVTKPTPQMRAAMAQAEVGDDVYGEDPTVLELERRVAALLGKEAAVWVPTGVMANQIALGSLAGMGEEIICERNSHIVHYEGGAISALWGAQSLVIDGPAGIFDEAAVEAVLRHGDDVHSPRQRVLALENTHNRGGGSIWPLEQMRRVSALARRHGLAVHLDGARLWNAHVAAGVPLRDYAACADTVSVCLSKGLGAPAGSLTATTAARMPMLRRLRKRLGGGLRQVGILAAAGAYALTHHLARLAEDHANAKELALLLSRLPGLRCSADATQTNIVLADVSLAGGAPALVAAAKEQGVLINAVNPSRVRLVTHLDVPAKAVAEAAVRLGTAAAQLR
jgi:threonine aldolase